MALLEDIVTYLAAQSTSFTALPSTSGNLGAAIFLDSSLIPDTFAAVYETPGVVNDYAFSTSTGKAAVVMERPGFQILSRSTSYATARSRAQTAYTILDGLAQKNLPTSTGTLYQEIVVNQAPFFLQRDEKDRYIVATNYLVRKVVA